LTNTGGGLGGKKTDVNGCGRREKMFQYESVNTWSKWTGKGRALGLANEKKSGLKASWCRPLCGRISKDGGGGPPSRGGNNGNVEWRPEGSGNPGNSTGVGAVGKEGAMGSGRGVRLCGSG